MADTPLSSKAIATPADNSEFPFVDSSNNIRLATAPDLRALVFGGASVNIVGIGDSHTNGQIPVATVGSDSLGAPGLSGPRDFMWTGTARAPFRADSQIMVTTGSLDGNTVVGVNSGSYLFWIPELFRRSVGAGDITIANCGVGGSSSFTWAGEQATAFVVGSALPLAGDTITIGPVTYTWASSATAPNEVTIGASVALSLANLAAAVNLQGTGYGAGTAINPSIYVSITAAASLRCQAKLTGTAGNSLQLSTSAAGRIGTADRFLAPANPVGLVGGSTTSGLYANMASRVSTMGEVNYILITLGTNDALRFGYRGAHTQAELTSLFTKLNTDFPNAKILMWRPLDITVGAGAGPVATVLAAVDAAISAAAGYVYPVDVASLSASGGGTKLLQSGGVHATHYGYQMIAQLFARKMYEIA